MTERPMVTAGNAIGRAEGVGGSGGKAAIEREKSRGAWQSNNHTSTTGERYEREVDRPAPTIVSGTRSAKWVAERPATTVAGDSRVWPPGHKVNAKDRERHADADERYGDRAGTHAERVTVAEAAALQSYPPGFEWCGTKTKQFLQIGNAVPPLLAEAILREVTS